MRSKTFLSALFLKSFVRLSEKFGKKNFRKNVLDIELNFSDFSQYVTILWAGLEPNFFQIFL